jgi:hypothetical protein
MAKGRKSRHDRSLADAMTDQRQAFIAKFGREVYAMRRVWIGVGI